MEPLRTVPDDMTARSAETADAVAEALKSDLAPMPDWLVTGHQEQASRRTRAIERTLELAASGESPSARDRQGMRAVGAEFARNQAPLSLLVTALEVAIVALMRESWRALPGDRFADMTRFTSQVALLAEQGRQVALHGYLEARAEIDGRPAREIMAEALISGECTPEAVRAMGERLAPSYLVLACAVPAPAQVDARQLAAVHRAIDDVAGSLHCGDPPPAPPSESTTRRSTSASSA